MSRKRKAIPLSEQLASALACLLPQAQRDELRHARVPAKAVRALFEMDHLVLFAHGGRDTWENIDPKLKADHREKSRRDTSIAAKVKRLQRKNGLPPSVLAMAEVIDRQPRQPRRAGRGAFSVSGPTKARPKRRIASRPFPKKQRPMRWGHANPHRMAP